MRITTTLAAAVTIAAFATTTMAGGLANEIMEAPADVTDEMAPAAKSSVNPTYIVLGVLAAVLIAAAVGQDDDDDEPTEVMVEEPTSLPG